MCVTNSTAGIATTSAPITETPVVDAVITTVILGPSSSPQDSPSANTDSSRQTTPAVRVIAGSVVGSLAFVAVLILVFVLWRRRKNRNRANASDDIDLETSLPSYPIITSMLTTSTRTRAGSIKSLTSKPSALPITLSWSSRHVYEEIERLQEENLSQRNRIRDMDDQMEFDACRGSPPPPSYRSRRSLSDISDPFGSSPSPPPLPPLPSPMM